MFTSFQILLIFILNQNLNTPTESQFCSILLLPIAIGIVQWLFQFCYNSLNSFDFASASPDCSGNPLCPPRKRGWSEKQVGILLACRKVPAPKKKVFIGLHPAFLSAKNPIFAFIRNNAQSGISKYSSRSQ